MPGSAQGLYLIVSDIAVARAELVERGVDVSEVFHRVGREGRLSGPDPARRSYASLARCGLAGLVCRVHRPGAAAGMSGGHELRAAAVKWLERDAHGTRNRDSDKEKFRSDLNRPESCEMSERLLKALRKFLDFQAEYEGSIPFTRSKAISIA